MINPLRVECQNKISDFGQRTDDVIGIVGASFAIAFVDEDREAFRRHVRTTSRQRSPTM